MLPLMLNAVNKKKLTLQKLQQLCCENPAKIFNIKNKGAIKEDYDADLTIIDLKLKKKVGQDKFLSKCGWNPFYGLKLKGWPVTTIINGDIVYDKGSIFEYGAKEIKIKNKKQ